MKSDTIDTWMAGMENTNDGPIHIQPYMVITNKPVYHPILGGPEDLVPEEPCPDTIHGWRLREIEWTCWESPLSYDKNASGFQRFISWMRALFLRNDQKVVCTYRYVAIWACDSVKIPGGRMPKVTSKERTLIGRCDTSLRTG